MTFYEAVMGTQRQIMRGPHAPASSLTAGRVLAACIAVIASVALASAGAARADTFVLTTGGEVEGTLLNKNEVPRLTYVIRTAGGGQVTLNREQVKDVHRPKAGEQDYYKLRPQFADTAEAQWRLAEWCRERQLNDVRKVHLQRIIELDPDHDKARAALGYSKVDGEWKTRDDVFADRGYVKDAAGRYRIPQQIEELKRKHEQKEAETAWFKKLTLWRGWLNTDRGEEALGQLQNIKDPAAVRALSKRLEDEPVEDVRKIYVEALARIGTPDAYQALTVFSLDDANDEIRQTCLDYLEKQPHASSVAFFIKRMRSTESTNTMVNRAAAALQRMKDPSAIRPLIDALVTVHIYDLPAAGGNMNPAFGNGPGGGSFSFGGNTPKQEARQLRNPSVHDALVSITGVDYGFDQQMWRRWLAAQRKSQPAVDVRRD